MGEGRATHSRFSMPLAKLGEKKYYLGIFFKVRASRLTQWLLMANSLNVSLQANWYKAEQYCRFHGMHLASINSAEEQRELEDHIQSFGKFIKTSQIEIGSFPFLTIRVWICMQHGHWTLIFLLPYHYRHYLPASFVIRLPRISLLFSFISSKECFIGNFLPVEDLWSSPAPSQLPATPYKPSSEHWIPNISSDPFHCPGVASVKSRISRLAIFQSQATGRGKPGQTFCLLINFSVYLLMRPKFSRYYPLDMTGTMSECWDW